jgi:hypothetical protein
MSGEKPLKAKNRSASIVDDDINSLAATGPVISVSSCKGGERKVIPSPRASYSTLLSSSFLEVLRE